MERVVNSGRPEEDRAPSVESSRDDSETGVVFERSANLAVYELADRGVPPRDIARRLNRPIGEVELILSLRATSRIPR